MDTDGASSSRMAAQLIEALKEAEDLEQLESNWSVKQNVEETIKFLHQAIYFYLKFYSQMNQQWLILIYNLSCYRLTHSIFHCGTQFIKPNFHPPPPPYPHRILDPILFPS